MKEIILKEEVYAIVGAAMDVYWQLGRGFVEPIYQEALEIELGRRRIPFEAQQDVVVLYKGKPLKKKYAADFICYGQIILEALGGRDLGQLLNYMKVQGWITN